MDFLDNVNLETIREIYGEDYIELINDNIEIINENVEIMKQFNFTDIEGIFEAYPDIFVFNSSEFKEKINELIKNLGPDYSEKIGNDIGLIEQMY